MGEGEGEGFAAIFPGLVRLRAAPATASAANLKMDIHLRSGKDRPVRFGHPWIFSGAIRDLDASIEPGTVVQVRAANGELLGSGYINPGCAIAIRMLALGDEPIDPAFIAKRVDAAIALRRAVIGPGTTAYRLINGEGDGLPGFVVDRYEDVLVLQCLTAGAERLKAWVVEALIASVAPRAIIERSDGSVREAEGLATSSGMLHGRPPGEVVVCENGLRFAVTPGSGQKTGHFCDQRPNRRLLRDLAGGRRVLDAFAYTGGFAVHGGAGGAVKVVVVDSSARALEVAQQNWVLNALPDAAAEFVHGDVERYLRETGRVFDLIVLDPPALAKQRKDVPRAARAYKDLNLWSFRRAAPGAFVLTFTCSQHVDAQFFRKIVLAAAVDAQRSVQLLQHLGPGADHPVALGHPEGEYLHGVLLRVS